MECGAHAWCALLLGSPSYLPQHPAESLWLMERISLWEVDMWSFPFWADDKTQELLHPVNKLPYQHSVWRHQNVLAFEMWWHTRRNQFRLSAKRTNPFKSARASVQSTIGSRGVRIGGSNAGYTKFRGSVKGTGYPIHSPVSPSLSLPCVTVCHHISIGLYRWSGECYSSHDIRPVSPYLENLLRLWNATMSCQIKPRMVPAGCSANKTACACMNFLSPFLGAPEK